MDYPRVSIVTPSFNQAEYLEETLRSVIDQRTDVHEYLVLDGGSTDGSVDIINKYREGIDWWRSGKDGGQASAIRDGFSRTSGDVLMWINSDDVILPGAVAKVREAFAADPSLVVVTGDVVVIDEESLILKARRYSTPSIRKASLGMNLVCQQGWYFRADAYRECGGIDAGFACAMDADLWWKFLRRGYRWRHLRAYLGAFRVHGQSKTSSWGQKWQQDHETLSQRYADIRKRNRNIWWGQPAAKIARTLSGRQIRSAYESARWKGKRLGQVFPAYRTSSTVATTI